MEKLTSSQILEACRDYDQEVSQGIKAGMIDFENRFRDDSPAERIEAMAAEICSSGLLIPDPAGGASNLRFSHKQFFEYLIAKGIAIRSNPSSFNAAQLLGKSSRDAKINTRLKNEPNVIS